MSGISPGNIGALNLAGSFAGAQRGDAHTDRNKADSAEQKFKIDQQAMAAHSTDDVAEADLSPERDADGRLPYSQTPRPDDHSEDSDEHQPERGPDAFGERGGSLDLEA